MVYDASSKTPGGESLNGCLDKGQNRLCKLKHLLLRFRMGQEAVTADISMAYNSTKAAPRPFEVSAVPVERLVIAAESSKSHVCVH
jgi:hypothetical protein